MTGSRAQEDQMNITAGKRVMVNIFDGHIKDKPGIVFGSGVNTDGENVYLVEMEDQKPEPGGKYEGTEQLKHGKKWVLSLYPEEVRAI